MRKCPFCESSRLAHFRLDSDWGYGGDWTPENIDSAGKPDPNAGYTEDELGAFAHNERPDVECVICAQCGAYLDANDEE